MKFSYSKKRLYVNLILGILWTVIALSYFFTNEEIKWNVYATLILAILYITMFLYENIQKYIEVTEDKIKVNSIPSKEINLNELTDLKYYADDYTFKTPSKSIKIELIAKIFDENFIPACRNILLPAVNIFDSYLVLFKYLIKISSSRTI